DRGVEAYDLPVDADLAHEALDCLRHAREVGDLREQDAGRELPSILLADAVTADFPAGFVQKLLRALDVLLDDAPGLFGKVERLGVDESVGRFGVAQHDALDDFGAVDRDIHRLAHALVRYYRARDLVAVIHQLEV